MRTARRTIALLAAGAVTVLSALVAAPAAAHDELTAVSPEPGAVLETAPEAVELSFTGEILEMGHEVLVTDSEGRAVGQGPLELQGTRVVQPLEDTGAEDETYRVVWRVVSGDGHPIEGTFTYQVGEGSAAEPSAPSASVPAEDPAAQAEDAASRGAFGNVPLWQVAAIGAVVALAVLGAVSMASRRGR